MSDTRRWKEVPITTHILQQILTTGWTGDGTRVVEGVPPGAKLIASYTRPEHMAVYLVFEHESFEETPNCQYLPRLDVTFNQQRPTKAETYFRWAYRLMTALAIRKLADANNEAEDGEWPDGQEWHELNSTSQSSFNGRARDEAGIPKEEFLAPIRSGEIDVQDIVDEFVRASEDR